jgi:magnesium transporter
MVKVIKNSFKIRKRGRKQSQSSGLPPGTMYFFEENSSKLVNVTHTIYDENNVEIIKTHKTPKIELESAKRPIHWVNVDGLTQKEILSDLGKTFKLHRLLLEDVLNTEHRPKIDFYENHLFFTLKALHFNTETYELDTEQVSFVLGSNFILSFQDRSENAFEKIYERFETGRLKSKHADYLMYSLLDFIVDSYFYVVENIEEAIDDLETDLLAGVEANYLTRIQSIRKVLMLLRKTVFPLRESIITLQKTESMLIAADTQKYFQDLLDHVIHVSESIDYQQNTNTSLKELYISMQGNKMNKTIHLLTLVSTVFIPLTFIVGVYGMNFNNMPELESENGYLIVWTVMILLAILLLLLFKRRKWL